MEWDGNIRQLRNFCERISAVYQGIIGADTIEENYRSSYSFETGEEKRNFEQIEAIQREKQPLSRLEHQKVSLLQIKELMEIYHGNKTKVAAELHISRTTLWKYLKEM